MKKIILFLFFFSFIFSKEVICVKFIETKGYAYGYYKFCVNNQRFIGIPTSSTSTSVTMVPGKCKCVSHKINRFLIGEEIKYEYKEIK